MQLRLPVVVIGGGLTAIDTATESLAYYPVQVEKFLARYETLVAEHGGEAVERAWTPDERVIADEFLAHARAIRAERAAAAGRRPRAARDRAAAVWGGVDHRLPPAADRQPVVHAQPRGSGEGAGGGHPLRRGPDPGRRRGRRARPRASGLAVSVQQRDEAGAWHETGRGTLARAHDPHRRRHAAQHRARARGRGPLRARRQLLPACSTRTAQPVKPERGLAKPAQSGGADLDPRRRPLRPASSATCIPRSSATWSRRWRARSRATRSSSRMLARVAPATIAPRRRVLRASSTASCARRSSEVERLTPTIVEVVVQRAARRAQLPARPVLPPAELRDARRT